MEMGQGVGAVAETGARGMDWHRIRGHHLCLTDTNFLVTKFFFSFWTKQVSYETCKKLNGKQCSCKNFKERHLVIL